MTYLANKLVEEYTVSLAISCVTCLMYFYIINLRGSFLVFWFIYLFVLWCSNNLAYAVAASTQVIAPKTGSLCNRAMCLPIRPPMSPDSDTTWQAAQPIAVPVRHDVLPCPRSHP